VHKISNDLAASDTRSGNYRAKLPLITAQTTKRNDKAKKKRQHILKAIHSQFAFSINWAHEANKKLNIQRHLTKHFVQTKPPQLVWQLQHSY